jgi:hypothetical protein
MTTIKKYRENMLLLVFDRIGGMEENVRRAVEKP